MKRFIILPFFLLLFCEKRVMVPPAMEEEVKKEIVKEVDFSCGVNLYNTKRFKKSALFFLKAVHDNPDDWRINFLAGLSLMKAGKARYAVKYISRALMLAEEIPDYLHYFLALAFFENEEFEASLEAIKVIEEMEDSAVLCPSLNLKAEVLKKMGYDEEVMQVMEEIRKRGCTPTVDLQIMEGLILCKKEPSRGEEVLKKLWLNERGELLKIEKALTECTGKEAERLFPRELVIQKMKNLLDGERWNEVVEIRKRFPGEDPYAALLTAKAYYGMRKFHRAREVFEEIKEKLPSPARCEAEFYLGKIAERTENKKEALDIFRRIIRNYPSCEYADNSLFKIFILSEEKAGIFLEFLGMFPKSDLLPSIYWEMVLDSLVREDYQSSLSYLSGITSPAAEERTKIVFWKSEILRRMGNEGDALQLLKGLTGSSQPDYYWFAAANYLHEMTFPLKREKLSSPWDAPRRGEMEALLSLGIYELIEQEVNYILKRYPESASEFLSNLSEKYPDFIVKAKPSITNLLYPLAHSEVVFRVAEEFSMDPYLILSVMKAESAFQRFAISRANAMGLMQIIKPTALFITSRLPVESFEINDLFLPEINIRMGTWYLKYLLDTFYELVPAISAYNAGPENVKKWCSLHGHRPTVDFVELIPFQETHQYVKRVIRFYGIYRNLYAPPFEPEKVFKERACGVNSS